LQLTGVGLYLIYPRIWLKFQIQTHEIRGCFIVIAFLSFIQKYPLELSKNGNRIETERTRTNSALWCCCWLIELGLICTMRRHELCWSQVRKLVWTETVEETKWTSVRIRWQNVGQDQNLGAGKILNDLRSRQHIENV